MRRTKVHPCNFRALAHMPHELEWIERILAIITTWPMQKKVRAYGWVRNRLNTIREEV